MNPMEPWWNQIHRGKNDVRGFISSRSEKDKAKHIGDTLTNANKEMQGWVKVENIYLHKELVETKREAEIMM